MTLSPYNGVYLHTLTYVIYSPSLDVSMHRLIQKSLQVVCGTEMCEIHSEPTLIDLDPIPPVTIRLFRVKIF